MQVQPRWTPTIAGGALRQFSLSSEEDAMEDTPPVTAEACLSAGRRPSGRWGDFTKRRSVPSNWTVGGKVSRSSSRTNAAVSIKPTPSITRVRMRSSVRISSDPISCRYFVLFSRTELEAARRKGSQRIVAPIAEGRGSHKRPWGDRSPPSLGIKPTALGPHEQSSVVAFFPRSLMRNLRAAASG